MYSLKIWSPFFEHVAINEFEEISFAEVEEYVRDFLWSEILDSLISLYPNEPIGYFTDVNEIGNDLYNFFENTIQRAERIVAIFEELDSNYEVPITKEICLKELFLEIVEESSADESYCVNTGAVVEDSLYRFIKSSTWHWGLLCTGGGVITEMTPNFSASIEITEQFHFYHNGIELFPILWYGPEGQSPIPRWTISPLDTVEKIHFWFKTENHEIMENLQDDPDQMFLVWYIYECGRWYPDLEDILQKCPVPFFENDSANVISEKLYSYIGSKITIHGVGLG